MCNVDFQLNLFQSHKVHLPIYLKGFNFFFSSHFFVGNSFNGINPVVPAPPMSVGLHAPLLAPNSDSINTNNPLQPRPGMQNCQLPSNEFLYVLYPLGKINVALIGF